MSGTKNAVERRTQKRIQIRDDAFVIIAPFSDRILASIENLSTGGLSFRYISDNKWTIESLDIMLIKDEFYLEKIPVKTVSDFKIQDISLTQYVKMRKQCVQFLKPSSYHQERLNEFIRLYLAPIYKGTERRGYRERRRGIERRRKT